MRDARSDRLLRLSASPDNITALLDRIDAMIGRYDRLRTEDQA